MDFQELLDALRGDDPPDTIYDDLSNAYQNVVDGAAQAKVDSESAIGALNEEIGRLKAQNFDLLMAAQATKPDPDPDPDPEPEEAGEVDAPADSDPLFDYERK